MKKTYQKLIKKLFKKMNFIYALIDYTDFWKTKYICFNCGCPFKMYKSPEHDNTNFMPICRINCGISLLSKEKLKKIVKYQKKYSQDWKKYYLEKVKRDQKKKFEKERLYREKMQREFIERKIEKEKERKKE